MEGAKKGPVKRSVSVDTTFGLSASLAEQAGIDASWLGKHSFNVQASFAQRQRSPRHRTRLSVSTAPQIWIGLPCTAIAASFSASACVGCAWQV